MSHLTQGKHAPAPAGGRSWLKLLSAIGMIAVAAFLLIRFIREQSPADESAYYYDLSEQKLFVAPRTLVPPIRGLNDGVEDAVRAIVISTSGNPKDKASRKIAYLETYSPELKRQLETMRKAQAGDATAPPPSHARIDRVAAQGHRFVRRLADAEWHPLHSPEAEKIMTEWLAAGVDGREPVVCVP